MTNVEKLQIHSKQILGNIRERLGASDPHDTSRDALINKMTPKQMARAYAGWQLGDEGWADDIIDMYEAMNR